MRKAKVRTSVPAKILLGLIVIFSFGVNAQTLSEAEKESIHNQLREVKDEATRALDQRDPSTLLNLVTDDFVFTAMNNEFVNGKSEAEDYYNRMLAASDSLVIGMKAVFTPDILSNLYANGTVAVSAGYADVHMDLRAGAKFDLPLRWTATLVEQDGNWKIASLQFSANIFDNPIKSQLLRWVWVPIVLLLTLFFVVGFIVGKRRAKS